MTEMGRVRVGVLAPMKSELRSVVKAFALQPGSVNGVPVHTGSVGNADVDVQAKDEKRAGNHLKLFDEQRIMRIVVNLLLFPLRDRVRGGGDDLQPFFAS